VIALERLRQLQAELATEPLDDAALRERLRTNFGWLERFASSIKKLAMERAPLAGLDRVLSVNDSRAVDLGALRLPQC
jgi:hypothetical protein